MAERRAITEAAATRYQLASKRAKGRILDELCANTGWHRNHARKALAASRRLTGFCAAVVDRLVAPVGGAPAITADRLLFAAVGVRLTA